MAVSNEDIDNIARESADKVVSVAQGCHCGVAMWDAKTNYDSLRAVINFENPDWLQPLPQFMESILASVEHECGIDMSKAKDLSKRLQSDIKSENWQEARSNLALLKESITSPLYKCASGEPASKESNPGGNPKPKYLVRLDPALATRASEEKVFDYPEEALAYAETLKAKMLPSDVVHVREGIGFEYKVIYRYQMP